MGTPAGRVPDLNTGHAPCFAPTLALTGSPNVFANSLPAHRMGDLHIPHPCPGSPPHMVIQALGCSRVFANSLMWAGVGHPQACMSVLLTGSPNVFVCI